MGLSLNDFFNQHGHARRYVIAYSGGMDSHVLLALCAEAAKTLPLSLVAVHVAHGASPHGESWIAHCKLVATAYGIPFQCEVLPEIPQKNKEDYWRRARYEKLAAHLQPDDMLLTAHHADDQAETVLLQLLRGAGPKGLAGMPAIKPFAKGQHARPLLSFSRDVLRKVAEQLSLKWIEDESNTKIDFARNYLRHEVIPLLKKRWPAMSQTISRSAMHCAKAGEAPNWRLVLRQWIADHGYPLPSAKKMESMQALLTAKPDRNPCVRFGDVSIRRYQDQLYLVPDEVKEQKLIATRVLGQGLRVSLDELAVRYRKGGERIQLPHHTHHSDLKKLLQQWRVPPWQRATIPLLYAGETLVAIVGFVIAEGWQAGAEQLGWVVRACA